MPQESPLDIADVPDPLAQQHVLHGQEPPLIAAQHVPGRIRRRVPMLCDQGRHLFPKVGLAQHAVMEIEDRPDVLAQLARGRLPKRVDLGQ